VCLVGKLPSRISPIDVAREACADETNLSEGRFEALWINDNIGKNVMYVTISILSFGCADYIT